MATPSKKPPVPNNAESQIDDDGSPISILVRDGDPAYASVAHGVKWGLPAGRLVSKPKDKTVYPADDTLEIGFATILKKPDQPYGAFVAHVWAYDDCNGNSGHVVARIINDPVREVSYIERPLNEHKPIKAEPIRPEDVWIDMQGQRVDPAHFNALFGPLGPVPEGVERKQIAKGTLKKQDVLDMAEVLIAKEHAPFPDTLASVKEQIVNSRAFRAQLKPGGKG